MKTNTILELDHDDFDAQVLSSDTPVLVDFWADWCQPCHMLAPTIDEVAADYGDRVKVAKVSTEVSPELAQAYGITSIPSVLVFDGGKVVDRLVGVRPKSDYAAALDAILN